MSKRWKKFTKLQVEDIVYLYRIGLKRALIAEKYGRDERAVCRLMQRQGVPRRPRSWATYYLGPGRRSNYGPQV